LHISSENIAGVPGTLVKAERKQGHYSRLITYFRSPKSHWDDIVLKLPLSNTAPLSSFKKLTKIGTYQHRFRESNPPEWKPKEIERIFYLFRDILWDWKVRPLMDFIRSFDCYFLDGGLGILRNGKIVESLKNMGKKIVILYLGSDLRTRGALLHIEEMANVIFTTEFDHTFIHPDIHHFLLPFEVDRFKSKELLKNEKLTICHAPTNRYLKGSEYLIKAVENLKGKYDFDFLLMESMPHREVLRLKWERCDLLVDQLTDLGGYGYGMNSIEALSMGIPCITYMNPQYEDYLKDHPFINATQNNIEEVMDEILANPEVLIEKGIEGRRWVNKRHNYIPVSKSMLKIVKEL